MPDLFGFLNVDKPLGLTSHDVVAKVRRKLATKKVGHAGTLDPLATGVLVICVGRATRLSDYAMAGRKRYRARLRLGEATTTYDAEGEITDRRDPSGIRREDVEALLPRFTGDIEQLPPVYSAIKKDGRKLYEMARAGEDVELTPRPVTIHALSLVEWSPPEAVLDVECGSGTYIRSLAHDIGGALEVGAHLTALRRTRSGNFDAEDAVPLDDLLAAENPTRFALPPDTALTHLPALHLSLEDADHVRHGRNPRGVESPGHGATLARAYNAEGDFFALLRAEGPRWRPHKVFTP